MRSAVRVVLDTNIVVSALVWGGTPSELIAAATEERIEPALVATEQVASRILVIRGEVLLDADSSSMR